MLEAHLSIGIDEFLCYRGLVWCPVRGDGALWCVAIMLANATRKNDVGPRRPFLAAFLPSACLMEIINN